MILRLLTILLLLSPLKLSAAFLPVTAALSQVQDHVVTLRELRIYLGIVSALDEEQDFIFPDNGPQMKELASRWSQSWMIYLEAENFGVAQVQSAELEAAIEKVISKHSNQSDWKNLNVQRVELLEFVNVWLRSQRFLRFKRESTAVSVSDQEVREYFNRNRLKFGNLPFERFQQNVRRFLMAERLNMRMNEWFQILERKYHFKFFSLPGLKAWEPKS